MLTKYSYFRFQSIIHAFNFGFHVRGVCDRRARMVGPAVHIPGAQVAEQRRYVPRKVS